MTEERKPPTIGILVPPGARDVVTRGNEISDFDHGIEDHGQGSVHEHNKIVGPSSDVPQPPEHSSDSPTEHWYKKPIGVLGIAIAAAILSAAALAALRHHIPSLGF